MLLARTGGANPHRLLLHGAVLAGLLVAIAHASRAGVRVQRVLDWRNGLPNSFTEQVEQDPAGFLWIATSRALVRHGGVEARAMTSYPVHFAAGSFHHGQPVLLVFDELGVKRVTRLDGGIPLARVGEPDAAAVEGGLENLEKKIHTIAHEMYGAEAVDRITPGLPETPLLERMP